MSDINSNDLLLMEQLRNQEQQQQQEEQQDLQEKSFLQQDQNLQDHQNQQMNLNAGMNGDVRVNLPTMEQRPVQIQSGNKNPEQPEPVAKYIGFDKAYIKADKDDNKLMKELRVSLEAYFKAKEAYESRPGDTDVTGVRTYLEKCISTLQGLQDLCEQYRQTSLPLIFGRGVARQKKQEVEQLSSRIFDEIAKVGQDYVTVLEEEFKVRAKYDTNLRKRMQRSDGSRKENNIIELVEGGKLNLDEWNKEVHFTDYEQQSVKSYLRMRCRLEGHKIVGNMDYYTNEEMSLLMKINEYAEIDDIGRKVSAASRDEKRLAGHLATQQTEYQLYSEIVKRLADKIKDPTVSKEKKSVFESFQKMIMKHTKGTLTIPEKAHIQDYTNMEDYRITNVSVKKGQTVYKELPKNTEDRTKDPLFAHVPCVSDISQDKIGNCFLLASIAHIAAEDPNTITDMFKDEGENVVVRLYHHNMVPDPNAPGMLAPTNAEPVYLRISKKVEHSVSKGALWVNLLCKAYAIYIQKNDATSHYGYLNDDKRALTQRLTDPNMIEYGVIGNGGTFADALPILTGKMSGQQVMSIGGNVFNARTTRNIIIEESDKNGDRIRVDATRPVAQSKIDDQETAVFECNGKTYLYHRDSHIGLIPKKPRWSDDGKRINYLMLFSFVSEKILNMAETGIELHEILGDPKALEEKIKKMDVGAFQGMINDIHTNYLEPIGSKATPQMIFKKLKEDAIRTLRESCRIAKMKTENNDKSQYFTGDYTEEAKEVYKRIVEMRSRGVKIGANSRGNLGKAKSQTGQESLGVGVAGEHGYTVLDAIEMEYNGKTVKMLRVRNPWGHYTTSYRKNSKTGKVEAVTEEREDNGEFLIELTHFVQCFSGIFATTEN